jgi:hypothetical protein
MRVRIGGPIPIRFQMNGVMFAGVLLGVIGVAIGALAHFGALPGGVPWDDVALGTVLLGIALYFLGRIVDLVAYFRRKT